MKRLRSVILLLVLTALAWWLLGRMNVVPSLPDLFRPQPVTIEQTAVWVKEIKALAQLVTVSAYHEGVADTVRTLIPEAFRVPSVFPPVVLPRSVLGERKLVLIGKTTTHVGIDMQQLSATDIRAVSDTLHLTLPRAQVLDVILNPSGVDVFIEEGSWSPEVIATLKNKLRRQAADRVRQQGLLQQAEAKATTLFTSFFQAAGFSTVQVQFR